ncbi:MAG: hypothetical protein ACRD8K_03860 [Nitrososphaeraceae archaeon]
MNVQDKKIEITDINYIYEFINERECKKTTKIIMKVPPNIDKYTQNINDMIYDLKVTDNKGIELPLVGNGELKKVLSQFNDTNRNIKLQKDRDEVQTQFQSITILLFPSNQLTERGNDNFEITISYTIFNNSQFIGFFKDSIEYKELLMENKLNLITEIKVPQPYNIDVKTLKINSLESGHINNKIIPFQFVLQDPKHVIIQSIQHSKTEFIVLTWKIIINKINLNWIRFGFYSWAFIITFIPLVTFFHPPSVTSVVGTIGGLLATLLAIRLRNILEISLVERWNNIYIGMLVLIIIEAIFLFFIRLHF